MEGQKQKRDGVMHPGQDIVALGCAALYGTSQLACRRESELTGRYSKTFVERMQKCLEAHGIHTEGADAEAFLADCKKMATDWQPAGEGGILAALWKLAADHRAGFHIWLREIPMVQESIEVSEFFDLNPYRLHSRGCLVAVTDNGLDMVRWAKTQGIAAAVIGKVDTGIKRLLDSGEGIGFLERPRLDELYRCLQETAE